jgi:hypothetical protein
MFSLRTADCILRLEFVLEPHPGPIGLAHDPNNGVRRQPHIGTAGVATRIVATSVSATSTSSGITVTAISDRALVNEIAPIRRGASQGT